SPISGHRLRWLIVAQLALAVARVPYTLLPWDSPFPLIAWAALGIATEPPMLLAFWCAYGTSRWHRRALGLSAGVLFFAFRNVAQHAVYLVHRHQSFRLEKALWSVFVESCLHGGLFLASLTGMLLVIRRLN